MDDISKDLLLNLKFLEDLKNGVDFEDAFAANIKGSLAEHYEHTEDLCEENPNKIEAYKEIYKITADSLQSLFLLSQAMNGADSEDLLNASLIFSGCEPLSKENNKITKNKD